MKAADLIRTTRERHGLTQARLALRVGTTQTAISRLEKGGRSPSTDTLRRLLQVMGEDLVLEARPLRGHVDVAHLNALTQVPVADRLRRSFSWTRLRETFSAAGAKARR